jgi:uncharacterized membrane protein YhaH (DUF805 family)
MFSFKGRASRSEYIRMTMIILFVILAICLFLFREFFLLVTVISKMVMTSIPSGGIMRVVVFILNIMIGIILIAVLPLILRLPVTVRRLHDMNKSGYWVLLSFLPFVGFWLDSICSLREGTKGSNRFGEDQVVSGHESQKFYK